MSLPLDLVKIESAITEILNPDFLAIRYDLNYGNIQVHIIIGDDSYYNVPKADGITDVIALLNLRHPELFEEYEIIVEVFTNDDVIDYIDILKIEEDEK